MASRADPNYDAFISYSHKDRKWVDTYLLPALEQAGLRVAIDYRVFDVGRLARENMEKFVDDSRHLVLVMSPNWTNSEWSEFEYSIAQADDPAARRRKLVPIVIAPTELPRRLSLYTYADFQEPDAYQAEMTKVIRAISSESSRTDAGTPLVLPAPRPAPPPAPAADTWKADLSDLLVRSGRSHPASRRAFCLEIRVDPDELTFGEAAPRDFAVQLVNWLDTTGNIDALLAICEALQPVFKGSFAWKLQSVRDVLRG